MTTPLYPTFRKRIEDTTEKIIRDQVTPWVFLTAGPPFRVKQFDGREISYQGISFEGSPRAVFWGRYIDPFLEAFVIEEIGVALTLAKEREVDARMLLPEVEGMLIAATLRIFQRMAEIDRRLRGKGFPESVSLRSVDDEVGRLGDFIKERVRCEMAMWTPKPRVEEWYEKNKFWVWLVGTIVAVSGLAAKFL